MINYNGEYVLDPIYRSIISAKGGNTLHTVMMQNKGYAVLDHNGNEIVPFGKYDYIDGFDKGFARVKIGKEPNSVKGNENKWGIINEAGTEVLPVKYDNIWNFYNKFYRSICVEKEGIPLFIPFSELSNDSDVQPLSDVNYNDDYGSHLGEFAGTYILRM